MKSEGQKIKIAYIHYVYKQNTGIGQNSKQDQGSEPPNETP